jgi:DNA-binding IclR family transcriptional regulator
MPRDAKNPVSTTRKSIRILEALKASGGAGTTELATTLGMSKSTVHSHLSTLESEGFLIRDDDGTYRLGLRFLDFGGYTRNGMQLFKRAEPEINRMAERTGELANLMIEENGWGFYLYRSKGDQAVDLNTYAGLRTHLHVTALGKAILAHLPRDRVEEIVDSHGLPKETADTVTSRDALFEQLADVRERGYAVDDEETLEGVRCVAAPVKASDGRVLGSISVSAPTSRMQGERFTDEIPDLVRSAANVIELDINYS